jgi:hypothetical protein
LANSIAAGEALDETGLGAVVLWKRREFDGVVHEEDRVGDLRLDVLRQEVVDELGPGLAGVEAADALGLGGLDEPGESPRCSITSTPVSVAISVPRVRPSPLWAEFAL